MAGTEKINVREFRVIKYGNIGKFVEAKIQREIIRVVKVCSRIAILASIRIHCQAMTYARENMDDHLETMFAGKFKSDAYFREHQLPNEPFSQLLQELQLINRNEDLRVCAQPIAYLAKEYDTNLENNVIHRHRRWLKVLIKCYCRQNGREEWNDAIVNNTLNFLCSIPPGDDDDAAAAYIPPVPQHDFIEFLFEHFHIDAAQQGYFADINETWSTHIPFFLKVQIYVHSWNERVKAERKNDKPDEESDNKMLKVFRIIPQHTFKRKHITLDKLFLVGILNLFRPYGTAYPPNHSFVELWSEAFDLLRLSRSQNERFAFIAKTNGEDLCLLFHKIQGNEQPKPMDTDSEIEKEINLEDLDLEHLADDYEMDVVDDDDGDNHEIFVGNPPPQLPILVDNPEILDHFNDGNFFEQIGGTDLGQRNLHATVLRVNGGPNHGEETIKKLTKHRYKQLIVGNSFEKQEKKLAGHFLKFDSATRQESERIHGEQPSSRSPNTVAYLAYKLSIMQRATQVYMSKKYTQMLFAKYQRKQTVHANIANDIANGKRTLLFMGSPPAHENSPIRGHVKAPLHKLFDVIKNHPLIWVVVIDEYLTTQLCSHCKLQLMFAHGGHTVHCPHCLAFGGQTITMDRDENAARNIMQNGEAALQTGAVPTEFRRR